MDEIEELLREAGDLLRDARPSTTDPALNRRWGQRRRRLMDRLIDFGLIRTP